jgi:hypothetical protein
VARDNRPASDTDGPLQQQIYDAMGDDQLADERFGIVPTTGVMTDLGAASASDVPLKVFDGSSSVQLGWVLPAARMWVASSIDLAQITAKIDPARSETRTLANRVRCSCARCSASHEL